MPSNALERARAIEARQVTREAAALPQRRFPPSSEDEDEAIGGLRAADDGEAVEQSNALLERIRAIEARHAASEAEALRQRRCLPSSEDEDEAIGGLRAADDGEDVDQGSGCRAPQRRSRRQTQSPKVVTLVSSWRVDTFWFLMERLRPAP